MSLLDQPITDAERHTILAALAIAESRNLPLMALGTMGGPMIFVVTDPLLAAVVAEKLAQLAQQVPSLGVDPSRL